MNALEETMAASNGSRLSVRRHPSESARGEIIIVHGFGEHSGRYGALTEQLASRGYSVTAYDQRGHGRSEGLPGHIDSFSEYEEDLDRVVLSVRPRGGSPRIFLIGHSMGGLVTLRYLARQNARLSGAVISAPMIALAAQVPAHKRIMARVGSILAPRLRLDNNVDTAALSRDPEVGRAYSADPLVNRLVSTRWFAEASRAMAEVVTLAPKVTQPLLVMHGSGDRIASLEATKRSFELFGSRDKELVIYPGFYHELFNEPERQDVFKRVIDWLDAHTG